MKAFSLLTFVLSSLLGLFAQAIPVTADTPMLMASTKGAFNRDENKMTVMTLACNPKSEVCDPLLNTSALVEYSFFSDLETAIYLFDARANSTRKEDHCQLEIKAIELSDGTTKRPISPGTKVGIIAKTYYTIHLQIEKNPECYRFQTQVLAWAGAASETPVVVENCTLAGNSSLLFAKRDLGVTAYEKGRPPKPYASAQSATVCGRALTLIDAPTCSTDGTSPWDWLQSRCQLNNEDGQQYAFAIERLSVNDPVTLTCSIDDNVFYQSQFAACRPVVLDGEQLK